VSMLLELVRLFSHLYASSKSHAYYNIIFLLSGAGKLNYQGSKKWLEDQLDVLDSSLIQVSVIKSSQGYWGWSVMLLFYSLVTDLWVYTLCIIAETRSCGVNLTSCIL